MHPLFSKASAITGTVIASAIEVHRLKGLGLIESIYEWCLLKELKLRGLSCTSQKLVMINYKGFVREECLRFDVLVEDCSWSRLRRSNLCCRSTRRNCSVT